MAAGGKELPKELDETFLSCKICLFRLKEPKCLPCLHTFCRACVDTYVRSLSAESPGSKFPCPLCRAETVIPEGGIAALKTNFLLLNLEDVVSAAQSPGSQDEGRKMCSVCFEDSNDVAASVFCETCKDYLCADCSYAHGRTKITRSHSRVFLNVDTTPVSRNIHVQIQPKDETEIKSLESEMNSEGRATTPIANAQCSVHLDVDASYCCLTCMDILCSECLLGIIKETNSQHAGHDIQQLREGVKSIENKMSNQLRKASEKICGIEEKLKEEAQYEAHLLSNKDRLTKEVHKQVSDLINQFKEMEKKCINNLEVQFKLEQDKSREAKKTLETMRQDINTFIPKVKIIIDSLTKNDLKVLAECKKLCGKSLWSEIENKSISLRESWLTLSFANDHRNKEEESQCVQSLLETFEKQMCTFYVDDQDSLPCFANDQTPGPGFANNQDRRVSFGNDQDPRPSFANAQDPRPNFSIRLVKKLLTANSAPIEAQQVLNFGLADVKLSGLQTGESGDYVAVDCRGKEAHVIGKTGKLLRKIGQGFLRNPKDAALMKNGFVLASDDLNGKIHVFDTQNSHKKTIKLTKGSANGLNLNKYGQLLVLDGQYKRVLIGSFDNSLHWDRVWHVGSQGSRTNQLKCPVYITSNGVNGDFIVSDKEQNFIKVFDRSGKFLFEYGGNGKETQNILNIGPVCTDAKGNIYILDKGNARIHVLSKTGRLLCHLVFLGQNSYSDFAFTPHLMTLSKEGHIVIASELGHFVAFSIKVP